MLSCLFLFNFSSKYASADNLVSSLSCPHRHPIGVTRVINAPWPMRLARHPPCCAVSFSCCPEQSEAGARNACIPPGNESGDSAALPACDASLSILLFFHLSLNAVTKICEINFLSIQNSFYFIWRLWKSFQIYFDSDQACCFSICLLKNPETDEPLWNCL